MIYDKTLRRETDQLLNSSTFGEPFKMKGLFLLWSRMDEVYRY